MLDGNGMSYPSYGHEGAHDSPYVRHVMASYGLIYRPNALYRSLIQQRIHKFRFEETTPNFLPRSPCVALHIRRGSITSMNYRSRL
jgi:hypothetical protein